MRNGTQESAAGLIANALVPYGDPDLLLHLAFTSPGIKATGALRGVGGEVCTFTRASVATAIVGGAIVTAQANEARVDEDGLILEPAATNGFASPTDLTTASWTPGAGVTVAAGASDPFGGTAAFAVRETTDNGAHQLYQSGMTTTAVVTTFSYYVKPVGGRTVARIATNADAQHGIFTCAALGVVEQTKGTDARGEIEYVGNGWYRIATTCTPAALAGSQLLALAFGSTASTFSYAGDIAKGFDVYFPQFELNEYATSPAFVPRAAESLTVPCPSLGPEWCIECAVTPAGPQHWDRGAHHPLFSFGTYQAANSIEGYTNGGLSVCSVYDAATGELHQTSPALAAGNNYLGSRFLAHASTGIARPAVFIDGRQFLSSSSGAGIGLFSGSAVGILTLGATSSGVIGGFKFRDVKVLNRPRPWRRPAGSYSYAWQFSRGGATKPHCIAFLGDSITQGIYDVSIYQLVYPVVAMATKGAGYQAHNFGIGGNGTQQALNRWRADIKGRGYTKMILLIGINDVNLGVPSATSITNITTILDEAAADGVTVYPMTLLPGGNAGGSVKRLALDAINAALAAYATAHGLTLIDSYADFDDGAGKMKVAWDIDGGSLHPNVAGQAELAALVAAAV